MAKKIINKINEKFKLADHVLDISTSIGITLYKGEETRDILLKQADEALYVAKKAGRNTYRLFDGDLQE